MTLDELLVAAEVCGCKFLWQGGLVRLFGLESPERDAVLAEAKRPEMLAALKAMLAPKPPPLECPGIVYWRMDTGVVLESLPRSEGLKRCIAKPYVPYGAVAFAWDGGYDYRPLSELPPCWGLKPLDEADIPAHEDTEADPDGHD